MNIILDTNIIYGDWYLTGPNFSLLEKYLKESDATLFVPEIIVLETKNCFKKELAQLYREMRKLHRYLPDEEVLQQLPDREEKCGEYDAKLDARLAELDAERPGHSDIPHDAIVSRALAPRKPFREEDKGYRDTLLWEVILRKIVTKDTITFLISNNKKDFASKSSDRLLHADLIGDLVSADLPKDSVQFYSNLKSFIDEQVKSELKSIIIIDVVVKSLKKGSYKGFSLDKWFIENRDAIIEKINDKIGGVVAHFYSELEDPTVTFIEDPEKIDVDEVTHYKGDEQLYHIDISVFADMAIDVFVFKADYYSGFGMTPKNCAIED